jgi:hypothetical protein
VAADAVGAALISGGPLVAVGQVHGVAHALIAGAGLVLALMGVGLAIWTTSTVLSPHALLLHREVTVNLARLLAVEKEPAKRTMIERQLRRAKGNAERAAPYVRWLLALGHVWQIRQALERSRWFTLAGGCRDRGVSLVLHRDRHQWPDVRAGAHAIADGQPGGRGWVWLSVAGHRPCRPRSSVAQRSDRAVG